jgi:hypothetical protein
MKVQMTLPAFRELPAERRAEQRAMIVARLGSRPRPYRAVVVGVVLAILVATPALALRRQMVDFVASEPAPQRIQVDFDSFGAHTAEARAKFGGPNFAPEGPAREVMQVRIDGEMRPLWVVPLKEGGFCHRLHFGMSCLTAEDNVRVGPVASGGLMTEGSEGMDWIEGRVSDESVQEVELVYQDGERVTLPFVWVSPPIDAGFFAYDIPAEREQPGSLAVAVIGLDGEGDEVAHACLPVGPEELARSSDPRVAALCKREG